MKKHNGMRPQDIVILMAIVSFNQNIITESPTADTKTVLQMKYLSNLLNISISEVSESLYRSQYAGLLEDVDSKKINYLALFDFLVFGLKYVFPVQAAAIGRGVPTAHSAYPLSEKIISEDIYIWESKNGQTRGQIIEPLYKTVPEIIEKDQYLYQLLVLIDGLRTGNSRIFNLSKDLLKESFLM